MTRFAARFVVLIPLSAALALPALAQSVGEAPATQPAAGGVEGVEGVEALLERMHGVGRDLKTLETRLRLEDYDFTTGHNPIRPGELRLRRGGGGGEGVEGVAFHVLFQGVQDGPDGTYRPEKIEYLLKGDTLVDRNYRTKTQVSRRLSEEQQQRDPFKLGEGPFPLPIGQPPEEVRRQFQVTPYDPADEQENDLEVPGLDGTRRLRLVPRPNTPLAEDFTRIELDVDLDTGLPRQVITLDRSEQNLRIVELHNPQINANLDDDAFELDDIDLSTWNVTVEAM